MIQMKTLIVPCCGNLTYEGTPAYLLAAPTGEMLLSAALSGMELDTFDRIAVVIPSFHDEKWNATEKILSAIRHKNIEILTLDHETAGPANTILEAIERLDIKGSIVIKDADNCIQYTECDEGNYVVGIDIYEFDGEIRNLKNKSFLVCNEQNQLLDVVEKRICSSLVCLGAYGFADAEDFVFACKALKDPIYGLDSLYVSEIITYLMGYQSLTFQFVVADNYRNWGNDYDLHNLMQG